MDIRRPAGGGQPGRHHAKASWPRSGTHLGFSDGHPATAPWQGRLVQAASIYVLGSGLGRLPLPRAFNLLVAGA